MSHVFLLKLILKNLICTFGVLSILRLQKIQLLIFLFLLVSKIHIRTRFSFRFGYNKICKNSFEISLHVNELFEEIV